MTGGLLIRADANACIGAGHVMRCLALAQAWQDAGGHVVFAMKPEAPAIERRLEAEAMEVLHVTASPGSRDDATQTAALARRHDAQWVIVDGYDFGADFQRIVKEAKLALLVVDDYGHADHYCVDGVLNQNMHACEGLYTRRERDTHLLLGPRYVLLRREFVERSGWKRNYTDVARRILVTLGGGDHDHVTAGVIDALARADIPDLEARIVVGPASPGNKAVRQAIRRSSGDVRLLTDVTDMPGLMAWADIAVSAGGSTCWELAFMGLPPLIVVRADNQIEIAAGLDAAGFGVNLGELDDASTARLPDALTRLIQDRHRRQRMGCTGRTLVDGKGARRVLDVLAAGSVLERADARP